MMLAKCCSVLEKICLERSHSQMTSGLLEVSRSWRLPCDTPLFTFVLGAASLGVALALIDFVASVFKDPLPPVTKTRWPPSLAFLTSGWTSSYPFVWPFMVLSRVTTPGASGVWSVRRTTSR